MPANGRWDLIRRLKVIKVNCKLSESKYAFGKPQIFSEIHKLRNDFMIRYDMIYLIAIGFTPGGSSTVHIYTQTVHRTTQFTN